MGHCQDDIRERFGPQTLEVFSERKEEFFLSSELAKEVMIYLQKFAAQEIQFCKKVLEISSNDLKMKITAVKNIKSVTIVMDEELHTIKIVGEQKYVNEIQKEVKNVLIMLEKELDVVTKKVEMPVNRLKLFMLHGIDKILKKEFQVEVLITPSKETMTIKGQKEQVPLAITEAYKRSSYTKEETVEINEAGKRYLESGQIDRLNDGMKTAGLKGMLSLCQSDLNKVNVLVCEDGIINDIRLYLERNMFERKYRVVEDSLTLLKSNKWEEFSENVKKNNAVMIFTSKPTEISLVGKKTDVEKAYEAVEKFMKKNTIIKESISLDEGYLAFLTEYYHKDFEDLEKKLEEQSVRIKLLEEEGKLNIVGTKEGVVIAKKHVDNVISSIITDRICFQQVRDQEYIQSETGRLVLKDIQEKQKCIIREIKDDGHGETSSMIPSIRRDFLSKLLCSYETAQNISLKVVKGDITSHGCDVIVNAANANLKHVGGVAKSIVDVGGEDIQDECDAFVRKNGPLFDGENFVGSPGKLPCQRLIHVVAPKWNSSRDSRTLRTLRITCARAFEKAMDTQSIAIPAIGSGIFGIPKEVCADVMIEAAENFSEEYPNCTLKEICFVNVDDPTCQVFLKKFREKFGGQLTFRDTQAGTTGRKSGTMRSRNTERERKHVELYDTAEVLPRKNVGNHIMTKENMKISVIVGDLSTFKVKLRHSMTSMIVQSGHICCYYQLPDVPEKLDPFYFV